MPRLGVVMQPPTHVFQPHCPVHEHLDDIVLLRGEKGKQCESTSSVAAFDQVLKWQCWPSFRAEPQGKASLAEAGVTDSQREPFVLSPLEPSWRGEAGGEEEEEEGAQEPP